eukprot:11242543-Karenia_brevis.AAC.1
MDIFDSMLSRVQADITEIYNPPRVTEEGLKNRLIPGLACDLTTGWDFGNPKARELVRRHVREDKPWL